MWHFKGAEVRQGRFNLSMKFSGLRDSRITFTAQFISMVHEILPCIKC